MKRSEITLGLLRIPLDIAMVLLGFQIGFDLRLKVDFGPRWNLNPLDLSLLPSTNSFLQIQVASAILLFLTFMIFRLYSFKNRDSLLHEWRQVFTYGLLWILVVLAYFFIERQLFFSRLVLLFSVSFSIFFMLLARTLLFAVKRTLLAKKIGTTRVLLLGSNKVSQSLANKLLKDPRYEVIGYLSNERGRLNNLTFKGSLKELNRWFRKGEIDGVFQTSQNSTVEDERNILETCAAHQVEYHFVPDVLSLERSNVEFLNFGDIPVVHLRPTPLDGWSKVLKRCFDFGAALLGLIVLSPLLLLIAIAIKIDSRGPVLFSRLDDGKPVKRIGQYGQPFNFYKFRTMIPNSHQLRYNALADKNIRQGPVVKIKNDPRITRLGWFLRRFDLDELPQLWHVLTGHMSLVGPRPHLPEEVKQYAPAQRFLFHIKPGITGMAQVSGRSDLDFEDEVRLDTYYIKHWSMLLDFKILLKTVGVVLRRHKAE